MTQIFRAEKFYGSGIFKKLFQNVSIVDIQENIFFIYFYYLLNKEKIKRKYNNDQ